VTTAPQGESAIGKFPPADPLRLATGGDGTPTGATDDIEVHPFTFRRMRLDIRNNNMTVNSSKVGMNFLGRVLVNSPAGSTPLEHITLAGNTVSGIDSDFLPGAAFSSGASGTITQTTDFCVNLQQPGAGANIVNGTAGADHDAFTLRHRAGSTFKLQGFAGTGASEASVENFVQSNNSGGTLGGKTDAFSAGGTTIVNYSSGTCQTATAPPLP
jgi:hypothetical protein